MSIATAITDLSSRIQDAYDACEAKGATMPAARNSYNLSACINSIQTGGGGGDTFFAAAYPSGASGAFSWLMDFIIDGQTYNIDDPEYGSGQTYILVQNPTSVSLNINDISYADMPDTFALIGYSDGTTQRITFSSSNPTQTVPLNGRSAVLIDGNVPCLLAGTMVMLADGTEKAIEDIDYNDNLMVWDFENGCVASAKPLWIARKAETDYMYRCKFESGRELLMTGPHGHRGFDMQNGFAYVPEKVGSMFAALDKNGTCKEDKLVSCNLENGKYEYCNIITENHMNLFANGLLTSCRLNNYRQFAGLHFARPAQLKHTKSDFDGVPQKWIDSLHLCEQPIELEDLLKYVQSLIARRQ